MRDIPKENAPVDCQLPHVEILDTETGEVWQSSLPLSPEACAALVLPETFHNLGTGAMAMGAHFFRRSPGALTDGPVVLRDIAGHRWLHCANAPPDGPTRPYPGGPLLMLVDKHHSLVFSPDCEIPVLNSPEGIQYVQVMAAETVPPGLPDISSMPGWHFTKHRFPTHSVIDLPCPTHAWFFKGNSSFQGPVTLQQTR